MRSPLIANPRAWRGPYPEVHRNIVNIARAVQARQWLASWSHISPGATPLWSLADQAEALGIAELHLKDESTRSDIGSFKALGAPLALIRLALRLYPDAGFEPEGILGGRYRDQLHELVVISATDGNHGKALAAAAQTSGCPCVIVLPGHVSAEREQAIAAYGARIVRADGNYDFAVAQAARMAQENGWHVVSDTSWPGYETVPCDVMQGYGVMVEEIIEQTGAKAGEAGPFTHVFLQGGVGALPAGILAHLWEFYGEHRPTSIIVEPRQADCLYQSALVGHAAHATGSVDSVMAGLSCGDTSPLAWRFLVDSGDYFLTVEDADAEEAVRILARGGRRDVPIVAGESGVAGLAGLRAICADPALRAQIGLGPDARVLLFSTEGATAPAQYQALVGESAEAVLARQVARHAVMA